MLWDQPLVAVSSGSARGTMRNATGLRVAEEQFSQESRRAGAKSAYQALASEHFRFYRGGSPPAITRAAALAAPGMTQDPLVWSVERVEAAFSGEFGYARGSYASADAPSKPLGHYLCVWRLEAGQWRVALDVTNALGP